MKKIGLIALVLIMALGALGVGYAQWSKTLTINGTVSTGRFDVAFANVSDSDSDGPEGPAQCIVTPAQDGASIQVELLNGYPCYTNTVYYDIVNTGTVPAKISSIMINGVEGVGPVEIDLDGDQVTDITVTVTDLEVGDTVPVVEADLEIHVASTEGPEGHDASMNATGSFTVTITATQDTAT